MDKQFYEVLYDTKWHKFVYRARLFRFIPFVDFALGAGSMAYGEVKDASDFDCIVGVKLGRIFTARFFAVFVFGILGYRRRKMDHKEEAKDKICLNHFVTEKSYKLSPPYFEYWKNLYRNLIPVFGSEEKISDFFKANSDWMGEVSKIDYKTDLRYVYKKDSRIKSFLEFILEGFVGNFLEKMLRNLQIKKIKRGLKIEEKHDPRIIYSDIELEFHPDTRRIPKIN